MLAPKGAFVFIAVHSIFTSLFVTSYKRVKLGDRLVQTFKLNGFVGLSQGEAWLGGFG